MENKNSVMNYFFCSASLRPSQCEKNNSICCIHCDILEKCKKLKHKKAKPCDLITIDKNDFCEFSI